MKNLKNLKNFLGAWEAWNPKYEIQYGQKHTCRVEINLGPKLCGQKLGSLTLTLSISVKIKTHLAEGIASAHKVTNRKNETI